MLLQTNSYIVRSDQRAEHARLMRQFRVAFRRLGSEFDVYEEEARGDHAGRGKARSSRFVQMMRFRDRAHHVEVTRAEREDSVAQDLVSAFARLVDLPYQQDQG